MQGKAGNSSIMRVEYNETFFFFFYPVLFSLPKGSGGGVGSSDCAYGEGLHLLYRTWERFSCSPAHQLSDSSPSLPTSGCSPQDGGATGHDVHASLLPEHASHARTLRLHRRHFQGWGWCRGRSELWGTPDYQGSGKPQHLGCGRGDAWLRRNVWTHAGELADGGGSVKFCDFILK